MKKTLLLSLLIASGSNLITANDIKTDSASCGCKAGCAGELEIGKTISAIQSYEQVKADKDAASKERVECTYYTEDADHSKIDAIKN